MDFRANLKALHRTNHPWAAFALEQANRKVYPDYGQWQTIAYVMTGDAKYVTPAVNAILAVASPDPANANTVREYFIDWCLQYEWLKPGLSAEQDAALRKALNRICEWCFGINTAKYVGGWSYTDSDQTTGQYLGLVLADRVLGSDWTKRPEAVAARNALRSYCEKSSDGEWIESSKYNLGTLSFLLMGAYAAGIEQFPEVAVMVPKIVEMQLAAITPDGKTAYQWGSEEEPRSLAIDRRVKLWSMLAGLTGDDRLYDALERITAGLAPKSYLNLGWRALYLFKPQAFLQVAEGDGHFLYKRGRALLGVHCPKQVDVHHEVGYAADLQLYLDGEWALTRTLGYGAVATSGESGNSPLFAGLSSMQNRGPVRWTETASGCEIVSATSGRFYDAGFYDPPPAFVEHTRKLAYTFPGTLTVTDSFKGSSPLTLPKFTRYRDTDEAIIKAAPALWQQVWHCPVQPTETVAGFAWSLPSGKTVTLTAPANCKRLVVDELAKWATFNSNFRDSELKWQIRFLSDEPVCEMATVLEVK
jgi:hypothetical protein